MRSAFEGGRALRTEGLASVALAAFAEPSDDGGVRPPSLVGAHAWLGVEDLPPLDGAAPVFVLHAAGATGGSGEIWLEVDGPTARRSATRSGATPSSHGPLSDLEVVALCTPLTDALQALPGADTSPAPPSPTELARSAGISKEPSVPPLLIDAATSSTALPLPRVELRIVATWRAGPSTVRIVAPCAAADRLGPIRCRPRMLDGLGTVRVGIELGPYPLPGGELAKIRPGDVVLLGSVEPRIIVDGARHASFMGRLREAADARSELIVLGRAPRATRVDMDDPDNRFGHSPSEEATVLHTSDAADPASALLAEIPLPVTAVLERRQVAVCEIVAWAPGTVVPLDRRASDPVTLEVGGRVVARGRLLEIDGELAVRILELEGASK